MSFQLLMQVLPKPKEAVEVGRPEEWAAVEGVLGVALPSDYKAYIDIFGTGLICNFIYVLNPFSSKESLNLIGRGKAILAGRQSIRVEFGQEAWPYPLYPEPGGLLPWGGTLNGDVLFWETEGDPAAWGIIINEVRSRHFESFQGPMTTFLHRIITREINSNIITDILSKKISFKPI